jgi:hypothetical protein
VTGDILRALWTFTKDLLNIQCCMILDQWRQNKTLSAELEDSMRKEANYWRQVIDRIVNVTLMMASSNMAFRGHRENGDFNSNNTENRGNFLSVIFYGRHAAIYSVVLWAWPRFFANNSVPECLTSKRLNGDKSGITCFII